VRTGPYRFSRNPIYWFFILLVLGLSVWLNDLWLLVTLVPAIGFIAAIVIPREERFLEHNFHDQYLSSQPPSAAGCRSSTRPRVFVMAEVPYAECRLSRMANSC
jgi:hypothetical protein